ncbi:MAG: acetate/propionate family kinase [Verrucomicrobiota bacterium]
MAETQHILTLNAGSSSLKFALYALDGAEERLVLSGVFERIGRGQETGGCTIKNADGRKLKENREPIASHTQALQRLFAWLDRRDGLPAPQAVGHRVVHGGSRYTQPEVSDRALLAELRRLSPFDLEHLPVEVDTLEAAMEAFPSLPQVACFDTAFHRAMPRTSQLLPLPREWADEGIVRYGFHGLSYEYILSVLAAETGGVPENVVIAHLGSGCSLAAVMGGRPFTTTMGFTPTGGLVMGTRSGDLDPGLVLYLMQEKGLSAEDFNRIVNKQSGLLGLSGISADLRDLLAQQTDQPAAAEALTIFCQTARKYIAGLAAEMGGLDALVFTAGVGEHSAEVRGRVCGGLGFLGLDLDPTANGESANTISTEQSRVAVRVIPTNEELMIARHTRDALQRQLATA